MIRTLPNYFYSQINIRNESSLLGIYFSGSGTLIYGLGGTFGSGSTQDQFIVLIIFLSLSIFLEMLSSLLTYDSLGDFFFFSKAILAVLVLSFLSNQVRMSAFYFDLIFKAVKSSSYQALIGESCLVSLRILQHYWSLLAWVSRLYCSWIISQFDSSYYSLRA